MLMDQWYRSFFSEKSITIACGNKPSIDRDSSTRQPQRHVTHPPSGHLRTTPGDRADEGLVEAIALRAEVIHSSEHSASVKLKCLLHNYRAQLSSASALAAVSDGNSDRVNDDVPNRLISTGWTGAHVSAVGGRPCPIQRSAPQAPRYVRNWGKLATEIEVGPNGRPCRKEMEKPPGTFVPISDVNSASMVAHGIERRPSFWNMVDWACA
ncbi:hypothetical protein Bbelb_044950 [Branchiostoma belcheri]|nr:hypothetical protein Bbelb_044950 [Branchiostoma belcheri]